MATLAHVLIALAGCLCVSAVPFVLLKVEDKLDADIEAQRHEHP